MKIVVDSHTHTLASTHAYSTVTELAEAAGKNGMELLAVTDHASGLEDAPPPLHFLNYHVLPRTLHGVKMMYGTELNILDFQGKVDFDRDVLERQDLCIASFHTKCMSVGTREENTSAFLNVMDHPYVHIIGHPEDGNIPVNFECLVRKAKTRKILIEINNSSLRAAYYRKNTRENLCRILELCREYQTYVVLGTDAHFAGAAGDFRETRELLEQMDFPEELVANASVSRYLELLEERKRMA